MKIAMDLHTHTIASGHGYSTLQENITMAQERGLQILGFSEHGPALPGGPHSFFFGNFRCIPRQYGDLHLLCGAEANIMNYDGKLDLEVYDLERIDYVIASMHPPCIEPGTMEENTRAAVNAMKNTYVKILGHPDDGRYPLDYERLVCAAKEEQVLLEVNNSSLQPGAGRQGAGENIRTMLKFCREYQVPVILGSDSHISYTIGNFDTALALIKEVGFPEELVMNDKTEQMLRILHREV